MHFPGKTTIRPPTSVSYPTWLPLLASAPHDHIILLAKMLSHLIHHSKSNATGCLLLHNSGFQFLDWKDKLVMYSQLIFFLEKCFRKRQEYGLLISLSINVVAPIMATHLRILVNFERNSKKAARFIATDLKKDTFIETTKPIYSATIEPKSPTRDIQWNFYT